MHSTSHLVDANKGQFASFLASIAQALGLPDSSELDEGSQEYSTVNGPVSLAISRQDEFLAAQWTTLSNSQLEFWDAFLVRPSSQKPKAGIRCRRLKPDFASYPVDVPPSWFTVQGEVSTHAAPGFPGFIELLSALNTKVGVPSVNTAIRAELNAVTDELSWVQLLLESTRNSLRLERAKGRSLRLSMEKSSSPDVGQLEQIENPEILYDLQYLGEWAADNFQRIVVMPRAINGAKKSKFTQPSLICEGLNLLAGVYRSHRLGETTTAQLDAALGKFGFKIEGSVKPSVAGMQGNSYFIRWGGQQRFLDLHLLKGGGRDERFCMRIYFFWDSDSKRVICGALPAHLDNSLS